MKVYHNLFDQWTEQSAYILGFWYADGNLTFHKKGKSVFKRWCLTNTDKQIMTNLSEILGKSLTVEINKSERSKGHNWKPCYRIRIYSDKLFDFCYDIIKTTRKSYQNNLPVVPNEYFHHFVRGYFDGDGSIYYKHYFSRHRKVIANLNTTFTAGLDCRPLLESLRDRIRQFLPLGKKMIYGKTARKLIFAQYDSALLCEWMYKNATIYMQRKKDIWDKADKQRLLNSKKYFSNKV